MTEEIIIDRSLFENDECFVDWRDLEFSHPERKIRLATSFSGIGAIEHAFQRLGLDFDIVFAGDIDDKCKRSYFANYHISEDQWHSDIHMLDATPYLGKVDLSPKTGKLFFPTGCRPPTKDVSECRRDNLYSCCRLMKSVRNI